MHSVALQAFSIRSTDGWRRAGIVALFLAAPLLFAGNMVGARWMNGTLPPNTLALGRWSVAALLLLPLVWRDLSRLTQRRGELTRLALMAVLGGALSVAPQYNAAAHTTAGNIALIFAATPLLVAVLERFVWGVPLQGRTVGGIALAVSGILVATTRGDLGRLVGLEFNEGDLLALGAALSWSVYTALLRHRPLTLPPLLFLWGIAAGASLAILPFAGLEWLEVGTPVLTTRSVGGVLFLALVAGIGAYLVYGRVVSHIGAAKAAMSMYLVPIYALLLSAVALHETLQPFHAVAVMLVLGGVGCAALPVPLTVGRLTHRGLTARRA